jgi:hypothetical protein
MPNETSERSNSPVLGGQCCRTQLAHCYHSYYYYYYDTKIVNELSARF